MPNVDRTYHFKRKQKSTFVYALSIHNALNTHTHTPTGSKENLTEG